MSKIHIEIEVDSAQAPGTQAYLANRYVEQVAFDLLETGVEPPQSWQVHEEPGNPRSKRVGSVRIEKE